MEIHPRLIQDTHFICDLSLCELRMLKDEIVWFVLVPKIDGAIEYTDLSIDEQKIVLDDINTVTSVLQKNHRYDKLNIATIGNVVSQLHMHVVARTTSDRAWPGVIWGTKPTNTLPDTEVSRWKNIFKESIRE